MKKNRKSKKKIFASQKNAKNEAKMRKSDINKLICDFFLFYSGKAAC